MSPRSSVEDIFTDRDRRISNNNRYPIPVFGSYQSPIPYVITSPPHPPASDVSSSEDASDDDDDDVISLSTIPEVPSVMAGTLSPSEYLELGSVAEKRYRPHLRTAEHDRRSRSRQSRADTPVVDYNNTGSRAFYADENVTSDDRSDLQKSLTLRRRRLAMILTSVVVVFVVVFVAVVVVVVIVLGQCSIIVSFQYMLIVSHQSELAIATSNPVPVQASAVFAQRSRERKTD